MFIWMWNISLGARYDRVPINFFTGTEAPRTGRIVWCVLRLVWWLDSVPEFVNGFVGMNCVVGFAKFSKGRDVKRLLEWGRDISISVVCPVEVDALRGPVDNQSRWQMFHARRGFLIRNARLAIT